ncbi:MAG TPA: RtcB family protein [Candidatus Saccharimonadales bacterium]|nr:RtcB family protein [Candidatus Saccharimonadales bacterium]
MEVKKLTDYKFAVEKGQMPGMNRNVVVYATEQMMERVRGDRTLQQAANVSTLPGLAGDVLVMPDCHEGYGMPVGGVAAFDSENGIISPGVCGFDIGCGVRLIKTNLEKEEVGPKINGLADVLFKNVPSGVGSRLKIGFTEKDFGKICEEGVSYAIGNGFGFREDEERIEEFGGMKGGDFSKVTKEAKSRGLYQLGTLGAGNHFLEVQSVEKIFDEKVAKAYGLCQGQVVIMVHTGSRGFGHQTCSDYVRKLVEYNTKHNLGLVDPELSYAHVGSSEADDYLAAMTCGINYAFTNRQVITDSIRKGFETVFGKSADALGMEILYDLSHNIVKLEEHTVEGSKKKVYVHRKGATRAFPKGHPEVSKVYKAVGQPVLIPGSMTTGSYVLVGTEGAMQETFGSSCHGAGRVMSRHQAIREIPVSRTFEELRKKNVEIRIKTRKLVSEEAEWAYKKVDDVVDVVEKAGIARIVARCAPMAVIKG